MAVKGGLKFLRKRIRAVRNIQKVTKAMKTISSVRLKRAQPVYLNSKSYIELLERVFQIGFQDSMSQNGKPTDKNISSQPKTKDGITADLYLWSGKKIEEEVGESVTPEKKKDRGKTLFIVLGSDRGLCGAFNSNVVKTAIDSIEKYGGENVLIWVFGRRVIRPISRKYGMRFDIRKFKDFWRGFSLSSFSGVFDDIKKLVEDGEVSEIFCVYTYFRSVGTQYPVCERIFPFYVSDEWGQKKIFEPSKEEVIRFFSLLWLKSKLFSCFQSSLTSEHAARMRAMDMATQNAERFAKQLTLQMNKARQEAITKELIDIVNGKNALEAEAL